MSVRATHGNREGKASHGNRAGQGKLLSYCEHLNLQGRWFEATRFDEREFALQLGSSAHGRNGGDPAVDQEVCPDDVRRIVRREVDCQLRDFQRIGDPLAWIVVSEDALNRLALLFAWDATEHRRVCRAWTQGIHANPAVHEFGAEDSSEMADCGFAGRDGRGGRPPLARANGRSDDYRRALPKERQGLLNREVSPFEI